MVTASPTEHESTIQRMQQQLNERQQLLAELEPTAAPHIDQAAWAVTVSTRAVIEQITGALGRLEAGTYGACIRCGNPIAAARLEALPYTEACVPCQGKAERR
jgi:DnaK suppressor protein